MKKLANLFYLCAMVCCAMMCVLTLVIGRTDVFVVFLVFEAILMLGLIGDAIIENRARTLAIKRALNEHKILTGELEDSEKARKAFEQELHQMDVLIRRQAETIRNMQALLTE